MTSLGRNASISRHTHPRNAPALKISDRGYWISKLFYYQSLLYFVIYALRFRSLTFFSACNPLISLGGMLDERKSEIHQLLPTEYVPKTLVTSKEVDYVSAVQMTELTYPLIAKPNIGFKGYRVEKLESEAQLKAYMEGSDGREILIQEYVDLQREFSLMYYRYPISHASGITSLIEKKYPYVLGDGRRSLRALIQELRNPFVDKDQLFQKWHSTLDDVLDRGERFVLHTIGNYSRGARFYSLNSEIDTDLVRAADAFFDRVPGLDFCRIDLKANSLEDCRAGQFKILEINGAKSEPLHIYDRKVGVWAAIKAIHQHWRILQRVVSERRSLAFRFPPASVGFKSWRAVKRMVK